MKRVWNILITKELYDNTNQAQVQTILKTVLQLSRHDIARLKFQDGLFCAGKKVYVHDHLKVGDTLEVNYQDAISSTSSTNYPIEVMYEDEDILVVSKPAGIPTHSNRNHQKDSLGSRIQAYYQKKDEAYTVHAIGRLDLPVSGLVLFAKNRPSAARLNKQKITKIYYALVEGHLDGKDGTWKERLKKDSSSPRRIYDESGLEAITHYQVVKENNDFSLLKIQIETGRTHQIRAHCAIHGHPIVGDVLYGSAISSQEGIGLCCAYIEYHSPFTNKKIQEEKELPTWMSSYFK